MASVAGRSGRKAKPVARKVAAGNPGHRPINTDEPQYAELRNVDPPEWLKGEGRELWALLAPQLCEQKVLKMTDVQNLEAYCSSYGRYRAAENEVELYGITVESASGERKKNPAITVASEALRQMATFGALLGLDPSSRQRLFGGKQGSSDNPFAELLGGK